MQAQKKEYKSSAGPNEQKGNKRAKVVLPDGYLEKLDRKRYSEQTIRTYTGYFNAIKFYYEKVHGREKLYFEVERPRKELKLPDILSKEDIASMIDNTDNLKHKCLIVMIYSCGLRRSEVIEMKLNDIDSGRMLIKIRGAKGKKGRWLAYIVLKNLDN